MSQIEVAKLNPVSVVGPADDSATVSKVHVVVILSPGGSESSAGQAHVTAQKITRV